MMGVHPCSIKDDFETELALAAKELAQANTHFYAVGEIGLDYYWDTTHKMQQQTALRTQIEWAKQYQLPIVLHCRNSFDDTYNIVQALNDENLTGIFHCFSGTLTEAHKIMDLGGFYMGIGGSVTHKKAHALRETVAQIPLDYLLLETDAPYLAPEPFRSAKKRALKRNESAHITYVAQKIAAVKQCSIQEVATATTNNAYKVFNYKP
jgi:TatD DNase family protein